MARPLPYVGKWHSQDLPSGWFLFAASAAFKGIVGELELPLRTVALAL